MANIRDVYDGTDDVAWPEDLGVAKHRDIIATLLVMVPVIYVICARGVHFLFEDGALVVPFPAEWFVELMTLRTWDRFLHDDDAITLCKVEWKCLVWWWQAGSDEGEPGGEVGIEPVADGDDDLKVDFQWFMDCELVDVYVGAWMNEVGVQPCVNSLGLGNRLMHDEGFGDGEIGAFNVRDMGESVWN